jgi:hypothetical protein
MRVHPGRILGIIMGLVILATIFLVPIGSAPGDTTLWGTVYPLITNISGFQQAGNLATMTIGYILIIAFVLLLIAGFVGIFPLGTGVLGVIGMALITVGPYLVSGEAIMVSNYGAGFYILWIASIISLGASFWHGKKEPEVMVQQNVNVNQPAPPPPPPPPPGS